MLTVHYARTISEIDQRYQYHNELVKTALEKTEDEYGAADLVPSKRFYPQSRLFKMLIQGTDKVDYMVRPTSIDLEEELTPIRIPLDKGILGYRVFIIRKEDAPKFAAVKKRQDLNRYIFGLEHSWKDVPIYTHNGFHVETSGSYESLFDMLHLKRFDIFSRAINEAPVEVAMRSNKYPELQVEETLCLRYPFVRYLWFSNSIKGQMLKARVTQGLNLMVEDGTFDKIFMKHKTDDLAKIQLDKRLIIDIENPFLPQSARDTESLWFRP
ncbi:MAG: hypothetical protein ACNI27_04250 [Desulfovibrio sp.]